MSVCHGCGGVVGRDCFNPQECEEITRQQAAAYRYASESQYFPAVPTDPASKAAAMSEGRRGIALDDFMDYLTHADASWVEECRGGIIRTPDGDVSLLVAVLDECLEDPQLSKWRNAFVWRLSEKYGDDARVQFSDDSDDR